jgi:hypothetical protein
MKYIAKQNITFSLKSGNVKFEKGKEIAEKDAKDFISRVSKDTKDKYIVVEVAQKVAKKK